MNKIETYRNKIDTIDKNIIKFLLLRFKMVRQIYKFKKLNKLGVVDKKRELQVTNNIKKYSSKKHHKFMMDIFNNIIKYSKRLQR